jgi:CRISPR/Cas system-associated exonuclease Cas4 (RecB family)
LTIDILPRVLARMVIDDPNAAKSGDTSADEDSADHLLDDITATRFKKWYQNRKFRQNIRDGKPYFNGPSSVPPPERHSPSKLLQCHRKIYYRQENAPEEQDDAEGILWTGRRIEEDVVLPFLQDVVATDQTYVRNSMWLDFMVEVEDTEIRIKGVTDPVLVDNESSPLLPTEIKSTSSIEYKDSPNRHHRAQLHAYLAGLSAEYDQSLTEGVLIYVSRETFDMKAFRVKFDTEFWDETVVSWANTHTEYRVNGNLPPAHPEADWECEYCSYRERCGKGDKPYADMGPEGFLPDVAFYPRNKVEAYLEAHDGAKLTSILAEEHPDLAQKYDVKMWQCPSCTNSFENSEISADPGTSSRPLCPKCIQDESLVELISPIKAQERT